MTKFYFQREARTSYSECYLVLENEDNVGRLDIHYSNPVIHVTLNVNESLTQDRIQTLVNTMDEELLDSVGITRQELIIHVHQGRDLGVFSARDFDGNGGYDRLN